MRSTHAEPAAPPRDGAASNGPDASLGARFPSPLILSILDFEDRAARTGLQWLRTGLRDMLAADLSLRPDLIVVPRERLDDVIREQSLQGNGHITDEEAVRIGRIVGATVVVTGSFTVAQGLLRLDAQLIGVERGAVLGTADAMGPVDHAPALAADLVRRIGQSLPSGSSSDGALS